MSACNADVGRFLMSVLPAGEQDWRIATTRLEARQRRSASSLLDCDYTDRVDLVRVSEHRESVGRRESCDLASCPQADSFACHLHRARECVEDEHAVPLSSRTSKSASRRLSARSTAVVDICIPELEPCRLSRNRSRNLYRALRPLRPSRTLRCLCRRFKRRHSRRSSIPANGQSPPIFEKRAPLLSSMLAGRPRQQVALRLR